MEKPLSRTERLYYDFCGSMTQMNPRTHIATSARIVN